MAANSSYKQQIPLETRRAHISWTKMYYPYVIPVILENAEKSQCPDMPQIMHYFPYNARVGHFADHIRYLLNLNSGRAFFLFATDKSKLLRTNTLMSTVYREYEDKEDGALYITYSDRRLGTQPNLSYKQRYSLDQRRKHVDLAKLKNLIPVILENAEHSHYPDIARNIFADRISFNINLNSRNPFFLYTTNNGKVLTRHELMSTVYDLNKDEEDGALYIQYSDVFSLGQHCRS